MIYYMRWMVGKQEQKNPNEVSLQSHHLLSILHGRSMEKAMESHVYSYTNGFRGFTTKLTEEQALDMAEMHGVVSVFPNQRMIMHTTHSWDFMGLTNESLDIPGFPTKNQENVIIGFIDTVRASLAQRRPISEAPYAQIIFNETFQLKQTHTVVGKVTLRLDRQDEYVEKWKLIVGCNLEGKWILHWGRYSL